MCDIPGVIDELPLPFTPDVLKTIRRIDVLWLIDQMGAGAFEVESTTVIHSGLFHQYRRYGLGKVQVVRKHRGGIRLRNVIQGSAVAAGVVLVAGSTVSPVLRALAGLTVAAYLAVLAVAVGAAPRRPGVSIGRIMAAVAVMHGGYGLGTWQGVASALLDAVRGSARRAR